MAGFYGGFALAPSLPLLMSHVQVSLLSSILVFGAFLFTLAAFPETPDSSAASNRQQANRRKRTRRQNPTSSLQMCLDASTQPFCEVMSLNHDLVIRLVAIGSFFSAIVFSTDTSLLVFYIENHLNVRDKDIAQMC
jgi:hypothetical protein